MNPARFFAYKGRFCTAPVGAAISRPRVDEDIDPYNPCCTCRDGSPSRPSAARPLHGRVDEGIDPYEKTIFNLP